MEEEIYQLLDASLGFAVAWGPLEEESLPRASIMRMSGFRQMNLEGKGVMEGRIQVDCFAETFLEARDAGRAVQNLLENYAGGPVLYCGLDAIRDGFQTDVSVVQRVSLTFSIKYRE